MMSKTKDRFIEGSQYLQLACNFKVGLMNKYLLPAFVIKFTGLPYIYLRMILLVHLFFIKKIFDFALQKQLHHWF
jgi:hypothetical protein